MNKNQHRADHLMSLAKKCKSYRDALMNVYDLLESKWHKATLREMANEYAQSVSEINYELEKLHQEDKKTKIILISI